jgi:hypothetical protein
MHHISSEHFIFSLSQWLTLKSLSLYPWQSKMNIF